MSCPVGSASNQFSPIKEDMDPEFPPDCAAPDPFSPVSSGPQSLPFSHSPLSGSASSLTSNHGGSTNHALIGTNGPMSLPSFLPNLNPDGWAWNERSRPRGGGMKRKNGMRSCSRGPGPSDGVDLNRNFDFKWGYARLEGSSANGCNEEYRGEAPFSEPESRAVRDVVRRHAVRAVLHWHGWGNSIAFPYAVRRPHTRRAPRARLPWRDRSRARLACLPRRRAWLRSTTGVRRCSRRSSAATRS